jgi:hypothetical protein
MKEKMNEKGLIAPLKPQSVLLKKNSDFCRLPLHSLLTASKAHCCVCVYIYIYIHIYIYNIKMLNMVLFLELNEREGGTFSTLFLFVSL